MNRAVPHLQSSSEAAPAPRRQNKPPRPVRLCWTRQALVEATGLCYRTIVHLEQRGLLCRCLVGVNVACYTHGSVQALFGDPATPEQERTRKLSSL